MVIFSQMTRNEIQTMVSTAINAINMNTSLYASTLASRVAAVAMARMP